jgi:hypothetical protein
VIEIDLPFEIRESVIRKQDQSSGATHSLAKTTHKRVYLLIILYEVGMDRISGVPVSIEEEMVETVGAGDYSNEEIPGLALHEREHDFFVNAQSLEKVSHEAPTVLSAPNGIHINAVILRSEPRN